MIVDEILDRRDAEEYGDFRYDSEKSGSYIYAIAMDREDEIGEGLSRALDACDEDGVKKWLCAYLDAEDYNPRIKDYILARPWTTDVPAGVKFPLVSIGRD